MKSPQEKNDMDFAIALLMTLLCNFLLSFGFVLQKKGISWLGAKKGSYPGYARDRLLWITGLVLVNVAPIFNFFAFGTLGPQIVIAVSGLNIVFTIFLSRWLLKNRLLPSDLLFSFLIMLCIIGVGLISDQDVSSAQVSLFWPLVFLFFPILLLLSVFLFRKILNGHFTPILQTALLAFIAGSMSGYMTVLMKLLRMAAANLNLIAYLASPYLYFYFLFGILSFVSISLAYKKGSIIIISPIQYGMIVLYPILSTFLIFQSPFQPVQFFLFLTIAVFVALLVRQHAHETR
jgi:drug/metabolite transporter (DMT)-like permease